MATLFNIELANIDLEQLKLSLFLSTLDDATAEQNLVDALYFLQLNQLELTDRAEAYVEEIFANSQKNISVRMYKVISNGVPTVAANIVDLDVYGCDNSSGLMTPSLAESFYREYYWMMGDYVEILNNSIVPRTMSTTLDSIVTREILDGFFLKNVPEELLSRCLTSAVVGADIRNSSIDKKKAIAYGDIKRFFFLKADTIDMTLKNVKAPLFSLTTSSIRGKAFVSPSKIAAVSLKTDSGTTSLKYFTQNFLIARESISNTSSLNPTADTNTIVVAEAITNLQAKYAPKTDWVTTDLKKSDRKNNIFIDNLILGVLDNIAPTDNTEFDSAVCKEELQYSIDKIMEEIENLGVCDDN